MHIQEFAIDKVYCPILKFKTKKIILIIKESNYNKIFYSIFLFILFGRYNSIKNNFLLGLEILILIIRKFIKKFIFLLF